MPPLLSSPDEVCLALDEETEAVLDVEPGISEHARPTDENYKYGRQRRWPHMSAEAETALSAKMDIEVNDKVTERKLKRQSREAR